MSRCEENGGTHCKVLITYYNQCAAASQNVDGGPINAASAPSEKQAENESQKHCTGKCQLIYSRCSVAEKIR